MLDRPDDAAGAFQRPEDSARRPPCQQQPRYPALLPGTLRRGRRSLPQGRGAARQLVRGTGGNLGDAHRWNPPTKGEAAGVYATAIRLAGDALKTNPGDNELRMRRALYRVKSGDTAGALEDVAMTAEGKASPAMLFYQTVVLGACRQPDRRAGVARAHACRRLFGAARSRSFRISSWRCAPTPGTSCCCRDPKNDADFSRGTGYAGPARPALPSGNILSDNSRASRFGGRCCPARRPAASWEMDDGLLRAQHELLSDLVDGAGPALQQQWQHWPGVVAECRWA